MSETSAVEADRPPSIAAENLLNRKLEQMAAFFDSVNHPSGGGSAPNSLEIHLFSPDYFDEDTAQVTDMQAARRDAGWVMQQLRQSLAVHNKEGRQEDSTERDNDGNEWEITRWVGRHSGWRDDFYVEERRALNEDFPPNKLGLSLVLRVASKPKVGMPSSEEPSIIPKPAQKPRVRDRIFRRRAA